MTDWLVKDIDKTLLFYTTPQYTTNQVQDQSNAQNMFRGSIYVLCVYSPFHFVVLHVRISKINK